MTIGVVYRGASPC